MGSSSAGHSFFGPLSSNPNPIHPAPTLKSLSSPQKSSRPRLVRFSTSLPWRPKMVRFSTSTMTVKRSSSSPAPIPTSPKRVKMSPASSPTPTFAPKKPPTFEFLPVEIRVRIYHFALAHDHPLRQRRLLDRALVSTALLRVNRQIHQECLPEFYRVNGFSVHPHEVMGLRSLLPQKKLCRKLSNLVISITPDNLCLPAVVNMFLYLQRSEFEGLEKVTVQLSGFTRALWSLWPRLEDFVKSLDRKGIKLPRPTLAGMDGFPGTKKKIQNLLDNLKRKDTPEADAEMSTARDMYEVECGVKFEANAEDKDEQGLKQGSMEADEEDEGPVTVPSFRKLRPPKKGWRDFHKEQRLKKKEGLRWTLE